MGDWREDKYSMAFLISKLYIQPPSDSHTDITFTLPDGGAVCAHKLILSIASPYFESMFYGLLATGLTCVEIKDVDSNAFRRLLDFIYNSGPLDWDMDSIEYWNLLHAAHMYLVPGLIEHCNDKLSDFMTSLEDNDDLVAHVNKASQLSIYEDISKAGIIAIKERLSSIIHRDAWLTLQENVVLELVSDVNLKVTEGELFEGMVKWCRANTKTENEAVIKFQEKFAERIIVKNFDEETYKLKIQNSIFSNFEMSQKFKECVKNKTFATREEMNPVKVHRTTIVDNDFLIPKAEYIIPSDNEPMLIFKDKSLILRRTEDEFADVNIDIKIYQKISKGVHVPRGKFGILLETIHTTKKGADKSCITERVSVKMVAKSENNTVMKKVFKPIEDSYFENLDTRRNIFFLSKNLVERLQWKTMEIGLLIDRRMKCTIKAISEENFATTVCSAPTNAYLNSAISLRCVNVLVLFI